MAEVLYYAIPFFVLLLVLEYLSFRQVRDEQSGSTAPRRKLPRCDLMRARRLRDKLGVVFRGPGWTPPGVTESEATRG